MMMTQWAVLAPAAHYGATILTAFDLSWCPPAD
jgi:hypothetical protein